MGTHLRVEHKDNIATVVLTTPTMPPAFFEEVGACFQELALNADLRCVVIQSDAKAFSYGLDLNKAIQEHGTLLVGAGIAKPRSELLALIKYWQSCFSAVANLPVPVIAAVHGWCMGGGLDLISACDLRVASQDAKFSLRETRIAIVADLGSLQRLPHIIGEAKSREIAFTGKDFLASEALQMGLLNQVHEDQASCIDAAHRLASEIAANPPLTVRGVKQVMGERIQNSLNQGLNYVATWNSAFLQSEDLGEAVSAFMERREPKFGGK